MPDEFQTEEQFEPEQRMVIKDLDTLKAISDPLRLQIVEHMLAGARTVKQLAQELNTTPTKLYYHINMLEQYGLIKVTGTRVVSGIIEKQYHVAAYSIDIDKSLLSPSLSGGQSYENVDRLFTAVFDSVRRDIRDGVDAGVIDLSKANQTEPGQRTFLMLRTMNKMPVDKAKEFVSRFEDLMKEFNNCESPDAEDNKVYGLVVSFYPTNLKSLPTLPKQKEQKGE